MKRDMDLIRTLLLRIEQPDDPDMDDLLDKASPDLDSKRIAYHLSIMVDAGFIKGIDARTNDRPDWLALQLTWKGNEFLGTIRDPEVWEKTKTGVRKFGDISIDLFQELAKGFLKTKIEELTGVKLS